MLARLDETDAAFSDCRKCWYRADTASCLTLGLRGRDVLKLEVLNDEFDIN